MTHHAFLADAIPLGLIVALFVFDLVTKKKVLAVTSIGGFLFWGL